MQLIPLEEVRKLYNDWYDNAWYWVGDLIDSIERITTIDPIAIIDEMIKENKKIMKDKLKTNEEKFYSKYNLHFLQELKSRLTNIDSR